MSARKKPYAPLAGEHPLVTSAGSTFRSAEEGLEEALAYLGATNSDDHRRMRVALGSISAACEALKASANAYSTVMGHVSRMPNATPEETTT